MMFKMKLLLTIVIAIINWRTVKSITASTGTTSETTVTQSQQSSAATVTGLITKQCGFLMKQQEKLILKSKKVLSDGITITDIVDRDETVRYKINLEEPGSLTISLQSGQLDVMWEIVYNNSFVIASNITRNLTTIPISCSRRGEYDVFITSSTRCKIELSYQLKLSLKPDWAHKDLITPTKIRFRNQPKRLKGLVKWEKSKYGNHAMEYCLAVNTLRPQNSLCEAIGASRQGPCAVFNLNDILQSTRRKTEVKVDHSTVTVACTGRRTRQILKGLQPNSLYYLDVFGVYTLQMNKTFRLGTLTAWFNRTRPIQLQEGRVRVGKLATLDRLAVFSFKVPIKSTSGFFQIHLTPCGGSVDLEILKEKHVVYKTKNIYAPAILKIEDVVPGIRYIIRVTDADDTSKMNSVELSVTTKIKFQNLPQLPTNTNVIELTSMRSCHSATIAWYSSTDPRKITYCVFVIKQFIETRYYDNLKYCGLYDNLASHEQFHKMNCFCHDERLKSEKYTIDGLAAGSTYLIYVTAMLGNGKSLPYKSVRIKTKPFCRNNKIPKQFKNSNLLY